MTDAPAIVLVVDDDEAKRYLLSTWLRRAGHTVIEAGTGREALERAGAAELVLLDVNLPDLSGYEVCQQIKGDPSTAALPVVQVSATAVEVADRALGLTQGADAYLTEPTEPEELLAVVTAALRYYRARQRAERMASLLAALTRATLDINAAGTFDGLARAAAVGAARIFAAQAVVILEMPDGQVRRTSASPQHPEPAQRGGPAGLADKVVEYALGAGEANIAIMVSQEDWLRLVPDSTLRCDVCLAAARAKPDRPPVAVVIAGGGRTWRGGAAGPVSARAVRRAGRRGAALLRRGAPGRADPAAKPAAHGTARGTGPGHVVPLHPGQRSGRGRR